MLQNSEHLRKIRKISENFENVRKIVFVIFLKYQAERGNIPQAKTKPCVTDSHVVRLNRAGPGKQELFEPLRDIVPSLWILPL